jgi:hypothetical protein
MPSNLKLASCLATLLQGVFSVDEQLGTLGKSRERNIGNVSDFRSPLEHDKLVLLFVR